MPAKTYQTLDELDDLEESSLDCTTTHRLEALCIVARVFNANNLEYGLIGGTNFYLRGSDRTTTDVDIAISGKWSLAQVLDMLGDDDRYVFYSSLADISGLVVHILYTCYTSPHMHLGHLSTTLLPSTYPSLYTSYIHPYTPLYTFLCIT